MFDTIENKTKISSQFTMVDFMASGNFGKPVLLKNTDRQILIYSRQIIEVETVENGIKISYFTAYQYYSEGFSNQLKTFQTNLMTIEDIKNLLD